MRILVINPNTTVAMTEADRPSRPRRGGLGNRSHCRQSDGWTGLDRRLPGLLAEIAKGDATGISAHCLFR
jgi:hypothetical protein